MDTKPHAFALETIEALREQVLATFDHVDKRVLFTVPRKEVLAILGNVAFELDLALHDMRGQK